MKRIEEMGFFFFGLNSVYDMSCFLFVLFVVDIVLLLDFDRSDSLQETEGEV